MVLALDMASSTTPSFIFRTQLDSTQLASRVQLAGGITNMVATRNQPRRLIHSVEYYTNFVARKAWKEKKRKEKKKEIKTEEEEEKKNLNNLSFTSRRRANACEPC